MTKTTKPLTLTGLRKLVAAKGLTMEYDSGPRDEWRLCIDTPPGKVIYGAHGNIWYGGFSPAVPMSALMDDILEWVNAPMTDGCECDDQADCDHCRDE